MDAHFFRAGDKRSYLGHYYFPTLDNSRLVLDCFNRHFSRASDEKMSEDLLLDPGHITMKEIDFDSSCKKRGLPFISHLYFRLLSKQILTALWLK